MKPLTLLLLCLGTGTFLSAQQVSVSSFTPLTGGIGTIVTINGSNFSTTAGNNTVYFGSVKAVVSAATESALTVIVPYGAGYEPISVTVNNRIGYSSRPFIVTYPDGGMDFNATSFAAATSFAGGATVIDADWDGDGKIDIAYQLFGENRIFFLRNTTSGSNLSFTNFPDFYGGLVNVIGLAKGDFDADGKTDIVAATPFSNAVYVFRNGSNIGGPLFFFGPTAFGTGGEPRKVTVADIDGDGKPDIISSNQDDNTISVLRNTTTGTTISFAAKIDFTVSTTPEDITAGDLDGDGKPEVAVSCSDANAVSVLRNASTSGTISFAAKMDLTTGAFPWGIAIADLNDDNKPEVISSNLSPNTISVFKNNSTTGSLSFDAALSFGTASSPRGIKAGDLNADGKPDLVAACYFSSSLISVLKNTSSGGSITFNTAQNFSTSTGTSTVALADMNNDGLMDIMAGTSTGSFSGSSNYFKNQLSINPASAVSSVIDISAQLSLYPNPSSNWVFIKHPVVNKNGALLIISDISGKVVMKTDVKSQTVQTILNINQLQPGVYFVSWSNGNETGTLRLRKN